LKNETESNKKNLLKSRGQKNTNEKNGTNTRISPARGATLEFKMPSMDLEEGESDKKKRVIDAKLDAL